MPRFTSILLSLLLFGFVSVAGYAVYVRYWGVPEVAEPVLRPGLRQPGGLFGPAEQSRLAGPNGLTRQPEAQSGLANQGNQPGQLGQVGPAGQLGQVGQPAQSGLSAQSGQTGQVGGTLVDPLPQGSQFGTQPGSPILPGQGSAGAVTAWPVYQSAPLGVGLRYPSGWSVLEPQQGPQAGRSVVFFNPMRREESITLEVEPAPSQAPSLTAVVDQRLAALSAEVRQQVRRRQVTIGGQPAEIVTGLPSQLGTLEAFVLHPRGRYVVHWIATPYLPNDATYRLSSEQLEQAFLQMLGTVQFV